MTTQVDQLRVPKQARALARRRALIESAALVFERDGFAEATLADIGKQASSTTGAIYFYFPSKHELALAIIREQNERTFAALSRSIEADPGLLGLIAASKELSHLLLSDAVVRAGIRLSLEQSSVASETARFYRDWISALSAQYQEMQDAGEVRPTLDTAALGRATVPFFTGVHIMSEIIDDWAHLYRDVCGMWEILVDSIVVPERRPVLLEQTRELFSEPQPSLARRGEDNHE